jgi:hypothetical protein
MRRVMAVRRGLNKRAKEHERSSFASGRARSRAGSGKHSIYPGLNPESEWVSIGVCGSACVRAAPSV